MKHKNGRERNMDKISVIVPVYNTEKYLRKCVNSIINQTYKNLEIILVDDGSTDDSGVICDELLKEDSRIKVIHKENGGLSSARNRAMQIATGDFIGFVDSDDCILEDFYKYLYELINKYEADIAEGDFLRISDENIDKVQKLLKKRNDEINIENVVCSGLEALDIIYGIEETPYIKKVVVWNKLYKKELLKNIIFPEGKLHEDEFTTHKILYNANKIISSNKYIYGYMQTKNSIMRKEISKKRINDNLEASIHALRFFNENKLPNIEAKIMLRYLENCIELSGKINNEESKDKQEKLDIIERKFFMFYNNLDGIEKYITSDLEKQVLKLIDLAYNELIEKHNLYKFWNTLSEIIK